MKKYIGGLRWGEKGFFNQINVSFPRGSLWIDQGEVVLKALTREFHIPLKQIHKIGIKNRILYKGIVIEHASDEVPKILIFWIWTRDADEIFNQLSVECQIIEA
jgi:hypothetical protein